MSANRPDPRDEALRLASQSLMFRDASDGAGVANEPVQRLKAAAAQALATVALVDEQRTANLIALLAAAQAPAASGTYGPVLPRDLTARIVADVVARLGLAP